MNEKKFFMVNGQTVIPTRLNLNQAKDEIPPAVYTVMFNEIQGFYLQHVKDKFEVPEKIFGSYGKRAERVLDTYKSKGGSFGVLLTGDKGSGKTLITQIVGNRAIEELKKPVILVAQGYAGNHFSNFVDDLDDSVFIFDEFAKTYGRDQDKQDCLLSLLDGNQSKKRLVMLTENDKYMISRFMLNRPGRVYYHFEYNKVPEDVVTEFCEYNGLAPDVVARIVNVSRRFAVFNIDMVKAIVEEHQRYPEESIDNILEVLNIETSQSTYIYDVQKVVNSSGEVFDKVDEAPEFNEHTTDFHMHMVVESKDEQVTLGNLKKSVIDTPVDCSIGPEDEEDDERTEFFHFKRKHVLYDDATRMVLRNKSGEELYITKRYRPLDYTSTFKFNSLAAM